MWHPDIDDFYVLPYLPGGGGEVELRKRREKGKRRKRGRKGRKRGRKREEEKRKRKNKKKEAERRGKEEIFFLAPERSTRYSRILRDGGEMSGNFLIEGGVKGNGRRRRPKKIINGMRCRKRIRGRLSDL